MEHRYTGRLVCHLTGFSMPKPAGLSRTAGRKDSLVSIGPGVERVEEEARELFPEARIAVFSSDTVFDAREARRLVESMAAGEIDILVATQAAAKGHNFPQAHPGGRGRRRPRPARRRPAGGRAHLSSCWPRPPAARAAGTGPAARCCRPMRPSTR